MRRRYFAALLRLMWGSGASVVSPRAFKQILGKHAPTFSGYGQQDSHELCSFLVDMLHEDTDRTRKPYVENFEPSGGESDEDMAAESVSSARPSSNVNMYMILLFQLWPRSLLSSHRACRSLDWDRSHAQHERSGGSPDRSVHT